MYCHRCGEQIPESSAHCPICGNKTAIVQAVPVTDANRPKPKQNTKPRASSKGKTKTQAETEKSRWHTGSVIVTAIAAVLTAVATLAGVLYSIRKPHPLPDPINGSWVIVLSKNVDLDNAKAVVQKAATFNYHAEIYQADGFYRPVIGPFTKKDNAMSLLERIRTNIQNDAYVEDLKKLCPKPRPVGDLYNCQ